MRGEQDQASRPGAPDGGNTDSARLRAEVAKWRRLIETMSQPLRDQQGRIVRWFGTCTDIEELERAQSQLGDQAGLLDLRTRHVTLKENALRDVPATAHTLAAPLRPVVELTAGVRWWLLRPEPQAIEATDMQDKGRGLWCNAAGPGLLLAAPSRP